MVKETLYYLLLLDRMLNANWHWRLELSVEGHQVGQISLGQIAQ